MKLIPKNYNRVNRKMRVVGGIFSVLFNALYFFIVYLAFYDFHGVNWILAVFILIGILAGWYGVLYGTKLMLENISSKKN